MSGKTTTHETSVLNVLRATNISAPATVYLALFSVAPSDAGGGTEFVNGGYARQAITFSAPAGSPRSINNNAQINFPVLTSAGGFTSLTAVAWGLFDALTGGNLLYWAPFSGALYPATADATTENLRAIGSAFSADDQVSVRPMLGYSLPTGLSEGTVYFVKAPSADVFQLAATAGGAAINITADGFCLIGLDQRKAYSVGDQPIVQASALTVTED